MYAPCKKIGFSIPQCEILNGQHPLFIVERYDRIKNKEKILRIHQQDFCQAQGLPSDFKYETKGGPNIQQNYELLLKTVQIKQRIKSIDAFLNWICFNLIIGNNDNHSKNISFIFRDNKHELAPFYDLLCTAIYPNLTKDFAFTIGNRTDFSQIGMNQFNLLENKLQMKPMSFHARLNKIILKIQNCKDEVVSSIQHDYPETKIVKLISILIDRRIKGLRQQGVLE